MKSKFRNRVVAAGLCVFSTAFFPLNVYAEFVSSEGRGWTYDHVLEEYYDDGRKDTQSRRGELPIGIPSFKRRVKLPKVNKGSQSTGLKLGILRFHPAFSQIVEWDDNVRLSHNDRDGDVIFKELPSLTAEVENSNFRASGGYGMEIVNFAKLTEENSVNHFAHGFMEYKFDDLSISVEDTLEKSQSRLSNASSVRDDLFANALQVLAKYDRPRWAVEPGWTHNTIHHESPSLKNLNYNEDVISLITGYKISDKTLLLVQNDAGLVYYNRKLVNGDQNYWQILTGVRGNYIENMAVEAKAGFQARRVDEVSGQNEQRDFNGFVADMNMSYQLTPRDALSLDYVRSVQNSTFVNNSWYVSDRIALSYSKRFFTKLIVTPQAGWQLNRYPEASPVDNSLANRADNLWQAGLDVRYQFTEWFSSGAAYRFRDRMSNFDIADYSNNRIIFDLSLSY